MAHVKFNEMTVNQQRIIVGKVSKMMHSEAFVCRAKDVVEELGLGFQDAYTVMGIVYDADLAQGKKWGYTDEEKG